MPETHTHGESMAQEAACAKQILRRAMLEKRRSIPPAIRYTLSEHAARHIMATPFWQHAKRVILYVATADEMDTTLLLAAAWEEGKHVFLPRCIPYGTGQMELVLCPGRDLLVSGAYSIPEPCPQRCTIRLALQDTNSGIPHKDCYVIPGVAFDSDGFRLGMGGGYYDRLLANQTNGISIGFTFQQQVVDVLPRESYDIAMHALCTEQGFTFCSQPSSPPTDIA